MVNDILTRENLIVKYVKFKKVSFPTTLAV